MSTIRRLSPPRDLRKVYLLHRGIGRITFSNNISHFFMVPNRPRIKAFPASLPTCVIALDRAFPTGLVFFALRAVVFGRLACVCCFCFAVPVGRACFGALVGWACRGALVG